ncbi:uncharacterized protein LOC109709283 isoform X4 [Ananas comosus]|uniref:Uncharacterized protein LOC109709283 isoform X4 n=1 Tax=Ananas comosus TaxID=4615 RepID=A0A6P5F0Y8_ANACO|nr:uncharacterized protein LOC109709283 isoform X4 [Ananas comosus]
MPYRSLRRARVLLVRVRFLVGFPAPNLGLSFSATDSPSACRRSLRTSWSRRTTALGLHSMVIKLSPRHLLLVSHLRIEVLSVVIRPSNQLKITFLEAKDITDLGSLKEAAKIFVPGGANLYSARTIKIKDDESLRTYYFYEFGIDTQHVALVAAVNNGKMTICHIIKRDDLCGIKQLSLCKDVNLNNYCTSEFYYCILISILYQV